MQLIGSPLVHITYAGILDPRIAGEYEPYDSLKYVLGKRLYSRFGDPAEDVHMLIKHLGSRRICAKDSSILKKFEVEKLDVYNDGLDPDTPDKDCLVMALFRDDESSELPWKDTSYLFVEATIMEGQVRLFFMQDCKSICTAGKILDNHPGYGKEIPFIPLVETKNNEFQASTPLWMDPEYSLSTHHLPQTYFGPTVTTYSGETIYSVDPIKASYQ